MKNCSRALRAAGSYGNHDVSRSGLGHIAIRTRRVNLKSTEGNFSKACAFELEYVRCKTHQESFLLLAPNRAAPGWFPPYCIL
ncbi:hypothetical protein TNCV_325911 [Trichonephila clavipes]|nr:hypothetical protein TNCV_325911 [Trichonephila clavipes]